MIITANKKGTTLVKANSRVEELDSSFHWLCLKKEDFKTLLDYIPVMERHFKCLEDSAEVVPEDPNDISNYEIEEIKWSLYKDLAFLGIVTDAKWTDFKELKKKLESPIALLECDYLKLCKLLAVSASGSHFSDGFFMHKIKDQTILHLLKALEPAIELRDKS